ncbi:MAG: amidohydrolase family protein, partial [Deltaproteobacteria bacterium]|nr:amidohydrolase family protein [Deltaproteobacteria bacterium]
ESLGISDRVGSLETGKDADFIVLTGEPFTYKTVILATYIEGKCVWERPKY